MMAIRLRTFGVALIVFYLVGSKATKVGKELKARLEEGHQEAGYRNAWQVLCNSFSAFLASLLWSALRPYDFEQWCPATLRSTWSRTLLFVCLGHFACCLGDTLASELGILSTVPPRLITTFKPVPPGTNGGMSLYGTLASAAGGIIMGLTIALSLLLESGSCRREWQAVVFPLLGWGAFAGLFGSFVRIPPHNIGGSNPNIFNVQIDSLMGATIQRTRFSSETKRILTDESPAPKNTEIKVISGLNILTNNQARSHWDPNLPVLT
ncbi:hypothetical protein EW026_g6145 [Hermanssonia centrifuga]|uniref:Transmembrane protein 19 n=1 Tax=Hermanssonia centrifuga TaxID=98765 RepID=A0A4S4KDM8_9APHY|nr:hypothetical protein EW026_g6145 [Hermanssonia centrifuga]